MNLSLTSDSQRTGGGLRAGLTGAALLACGLIAQPALADGMPPRQAAASVPAPDPMAVVQSLIGDAACRTDADCHTIGVGHKACGGPAQYLPWSAYRSSGHALERAAGRTRVRPATADGGPTMSNCQVLADPGALCKSSAAAPGAKAPGRCALNGRADGTAGPVIR